MTLDTIKTPESNWVPLHVHSHYSDGLSQPKQLIDRCSELGYHACAITDHANISGCVEFMKEAKKKNIKPILGTELYLTYLPATIQDTNNVRLQHLVILAKNLKGWKKLMKMTSRSNDSDLFYEDTPRLDMGLLEEFVDGEFIAFSGHPCSSLGNAMFKNDDVYKLKNIDDIKEELVPNPVDAVCKVALEHERIFGKGNFFIEIQLFDKEVTPAAIVMADILRKASEKTGIPCVATPDVHYAKKEDVKDHRLITCVRHNTSFDHIREKADVDGFFDSEMYYIPEEKEILDFGHTEEEMANTLKIAEMCEEYSLMSKPRLPEYEWTEGQTPEEYLKTLCRKGWKEKLLLKGVLNTREKQEEYLARFQYELSVLEEEGLVGYFLIVQDYINWCKNQGWLIAPGRGSSAGSLICYLLNITEIDPIKYGLIFERFYNKGRNTKDHVALPDIDTDFPKFKREEVIQYVKDKYGEERVCQMITFGTLQGRGALGAVLRIHKVFSHSENTKISKKLPDPADISDKMESSGETSIIKWTLIYQPEVMEEYCKMDEEGNLTGELSEYFAQAIRMEGTISNTGKHAAGVIISSDILSEECPMVRDKDGNKIAGLDMKTLEMMGHVKFDFLGTVVLDKLMLVRDMLRGEIWD